MISMKCPSCGEGIQVDDSRPAAFCMYCGARIQVKAADAGEVIDQKAPVTEDVAELKVKAEGGDLDSQYKLGSMFFSGKGVKQDYAESLKWYRMAADQGDPFAMYSLSIMYSGGLGVHQSCTWGNYWANEALKHGLNDRCKAKRQ